MCDTLVEVDRVLARSTTKEPLFCPQCAASLRVESNEMAVFAGQLAGAGGALVVCALVSIAGLGKAVADIGALLGGLAIVLLTTVRSSSF